MPGVPVLGPLMAKVFGTRNERFVKKHLSRVEYINKLESEMVVLTDAQLRDKTNEFITRFNNGVKENDMLVEVFAVAREVMDRSVGIRNIYNPASHFNPAVLSSRGQALYNETKAIIDATPDADPVGLLKGNVEPVPAWKIVEIPVELYQEVRDAYPDSKPPFRARPFDVQLIGGMVLAEHKYSTTRSAMRDRDVYFGSISEMKTGEGKTIVAPMACYLHAIAGRQTHVVTVNTYLVRRDRYWTFPFFYHLGMTVGYIAPSHELPEELKKAAYSCNVVYGTTSEFGFDYLRDNMKTHVDDQVQKHRDFAIVDEVDSTLIDEARTPLIISGPAHEESPRYHLADKLARHLVQKQKPWAEADKSVENCKNHIKGLEGDIRNVRDKSKIQSMREELERIKNEQPRLEDARDQHIKYYERELDKKSVHLEHEGISEAQKIADIGSFYVGDNIDMPHLLEQALRAHTVYECDKDYVVKDGQVVIVDQFTGRLMVGRQWSDGLHQAIEAKEGVEIKPETQTMATITIQNFFKLYERLSGMTGTADTEAQEFHDIYNMDVVVIPTNLPVVRTDYNDRIYLTEKDKWNAIVEEIKNFHDLGRPVLVGTTSVENSEMLSQRLVKRYGIQHEVLNAKQHEREAQIIIDAGNLGAVMVATNMAGRGTDIVLRPIDRGDLIDHWKRRAICPREVTPDMADEEILGRIHKFLAEKQLGLKQKDIEAMDDQEIIHALLIHWAQENTYYDDKSLGKMSNEQLRDALDEGGNILIHRLAMWKTTEEMGGLHVIGTERHESRRIDNQLRGRSGRQGDNGSSRFFIALEDDLMTMFSGETTQKILARLGMKEGDAIEHPMLSKAVERAQRKVEERNFEIRKNILEYDEVMDHQRSDFYGKRQRILEARGLRQIVLEYIREAVTDSCEKYLASEFVPICIAEWVQNRLDASVEADRLHIKDRDDLHTRIRKDALEDTRSMISVTLGEYMSDESDPADWDMKGLVSWAHSRFGLDVKASDIRAMSFHELENLLGEAARERIDAAPFEELDKYLDADYAYSELINWANSKYSTKLTVEEIRNFGIDEAEEYLMAKAEEVYKAREIRYPVEYVLEMTTGMMTQNPKVALEQLAHWSRIKYGLDWDFSKFLQHTPPQWRETLMNLAQEWYDTKVDETVNESLQKYPTDEQLDTWLAERYKTRLLDDERGLDGDAKAEMLRRKIFEVLRSELAMFEQLILLQVVDIAWKDHLYFMDQLRNAIGFRSFAQQDPKIEYRREGREQYDRMVQSIRSRVSDLIFKAKMNPNYRPRNSYRSAQPVPTSQPSTGVRQGATATAAGAEPAGQSPNTAGPGMIPQPIGAGAMSNDVPNAGSGSAESHQATNQDNAAARSNGSGSTPSHRTTDRAAKLRAARQSKKRKK